MAIDPNITFGCVNKLYDQTLNPGKTREILGLLENVKGSRATEAKRSAYEAIVRLCDYLNQWNGVSKFDLSSAEKEIEDALAIAPELAAAHYAKGFLYRAKGKHLEALVSFIPELQGNDSWCLPDAARV